MTDHIAKTNDSAYKSLLYWRKNLWNGSDCVPVILMLEEDTLTMKGADDAVIFSEPLDQVKVGFTGWGTMVLTVKGQKHDIVGIPAADSPAISDLQKAELSGQKADGTIDKVRDAQPVALGGAAASAIGGGAAVVGAAASTVTYYRGLTSIREWKSLIGSPADQAKKMNYMTVFIVMFIVVGFAVIVIGGLND